MDIEYISSIGANQTTISYLLYSGIHLKDMDIEMSYVYKMSEYIQSLTYKKILDQYYHVYNPNGNFNGLKWYIDTYGVLTDVQCNVFHCTPQYAEYMYEYLTPDIYEDYYRMLIYNRLYSIATKFVMEHGMTSCVKYTYYNIRPYTFDELEYIQNVTPKEAYLNISGKEATNLFKHDFKTINELCQKRIGISVDDHTGKFGHMISKIPDGSMIIINRCIKLTSNEWDDTLDEYLDSNKRLEIEGEYDCVKAVNGNRVMIFDGLGRLDKVQTSINDVHTCVSTIRANKASIVYIEHGLTLDIFEGTFLT